MKGYKVFNPDFTCKNHKYEVGKEYKHDGPIRICNSGFHFCIKASHCFSYYDFKPENIVCEVEALGEIQTHAKDSKVCTDHIKIIRRLTWEEVLIVANEGKNNSGHSNSGDRNSGNWNSGYRNSGNWNSGNWNSGDSNSGYRNSGYRNSGNWNSGDSNSGDRNSGDSNSGDRNSGDSNSGYRNSGNWNSGDSNSGYRNSGNWNSGNWNSGDRNSGDSNSGYRNSGAFCTDKSPRMILFNKPCKKMTVLEWEQSEAVKLMNSIDPTMWIPWSAMNEEEKKSNPKYEASEGYCKPIPIKDAWKNAWGNWSEENKKVFTSLENFDAEVFEEITGIKTN